MCLRLLPFFELFPVCAISELFVLVKAQCVNESSYDSGFVYRIPYRPLFYLFFWLGSMTTVSIRGLKLSGLRVQLTL